MNNNFLSHLFGTTARFGNFCELCENDNNESTNTKLHFMYLYLARISSSYVFLCLGKTVFFRLRRIRTVRQYLKFDFIKMNNNFLSHLVALFRLTNTVLSSVAGVPLSLISDLEGTTSPFVVHVYPNMQTTPMFTQLHWVTCSNSYFLQMCLPPFQHRELLL